MDYTRDMWFKNNKSTSELTRRAKQDQTNQSEVISRVVIYKNLKIENLMVHTPNDSVGGPEYYI